MPTFRLLHASDLNIAKIPYKVGLPEYVSSPISKLARVGTVSSHDPSILWDLARCAYSLRDEIDAVVLTGDIAATGNPEDLRAAFEFVTAKAAQGYLTTAGLPTLQGAGKPVLVIPGNRDRFEASFPYSPGNTAFDDTFGGSWKAGQGVQRLWESSRDGAWLVLIGADFTLRSDDRGTGWAGYLGQGRSDPGRVAALVAETQRADHEHPGCCVLWLMHFNPLAENVALALLDSQNLAKALQAVSVAGILCGHTHQPGVASLGGCPVFVCGTSTQYYAPKGNEIQVVTVEVSKDPAVPHRVTVEQGPHDQIHGFRFLPQLSAAVIDSLGEVPAESLLRPLREFLEKRKGLSKLPLVQTKDKVESQRFFEEAERQLVAEKQSVSADEEHQLAAQLVTGPQALLDTIRRQHLAEAKRSHELMVGFLAGGAIIILVGLALALFSVVAIGVVTAVAGVLSGGVGALFLRQNSSANENLRNSERDLSALEHARDTVATAKAVIEKIADQKERDAAYRTLAEKLSPTV